MPTPEGPRPLLGHGWALLGGDQRRLTVARDVARRMLVERALEEEIPILILQGAPGFVLSELARRGLGTMDPAAAGNGPFSPPRRFGPATRDGGCSPCEDLTLLKLRIAPSSFLVSSASVRDAQEALGRRFAVVGYSSSLRAIQAAVPEAIELTSAETGFVDLSGWDAVSGALSAPED